MSSCTMSPLFNMPHASPIRSTKPSPFIQAKPAPLKYIPHLPFKQTTKFTNPSMTTVPTTASTSRSGVRNNSTARNATNKEVFVADKPKSDIGKDLEDHLRSLSNAAALELIVSCLLDADSDADQWPDNTPEMHDRLPIDYSSSEGSYSYEVEWSMLGIHTYRGKPAYDSDTDSPLSSPSIHSNGFAKTYDFSDADCDW